MIGLAILVALVLGCVVFAARSAPGGRHGRVPRRHLVRGAALATSGVLVMALAAWSTLEDEHYDDFGSAMTVLAAMTGGALLLFGLGPFVSWSLGALGRCVVRLPSPVRLAARDLAGRRPRAVPAVATTMIATALAITTMIVASATTAQERAEYRPLGRSGALLVEVFSAQEAATVRAAVQREMPGVPVVQSERRRELGHFSLDVEHVDLADLLDWSDMRSFGSAGLVGDRELLRYLTGDPSTPYDEGRAVVVTAKDVEIDTVTINYDHGLSGSDGPLPTRTVPAVAVKPADPLVGELFLPAKVVRDLGYHLEPETLIIDPSVHRTSAAEQERIALRLGGGTVVYVERGFQASTGWLGFVGVAVSIALGGALVVTGLTTGSGVRRVLRRAGGGSTAALRLFAASRTGLGAVCGTVVGAAAGCVIGLLLAWPMTASSSWDPVPRVSFDTSWPSIAALVVGLPALAVVVAGLVPPAVTVRSAPPGEPRGASGRHPWWRGRGGGPIADTGFRRVPDAGDSQERERPCEEA